MIWHGEEIGTIPVGPIATEAPKFDRPRERPKYLNDVTDSWVRDSDGDKDHTRDLLRLLASPNLCSKRWILDQYDSTVRTNTMLGPEQSDAAVVRIKESGGRALAMSSDVNPVYCYLDPYEGGKQAVAEAARNIACSGGEPAAITDCLNFGNPEKPEIMWQFAECIRGMSDACEAFGTPVVSGNVSFYNDTEGVSIYPTPTVGMVGILESDERRMALRFPDDGKTILLLGATHDELGGSEYLQLVEPGTLVRPPRVDLELETKLIDLLLTLRAAKLIGSAHDLSNGGLAIALAECSMGGMGCEVDLSGYADHLDSTALLFSETQARAIVTCETDRAEEVLGIAVEKKTAAVRVGETRPALFRISRNGKSLIDSTPDKLNHVWSSAFALLLAGDSIDDVLAGRGEVSEMIAH